MLRLRCLRILFGLGKSILRFMVYPFRSWANCRAFVTRNQEMNIPLILWKNILSFLNVVNMNSNPLNDMSYEKNDDDNGNMKR